MTLFCMFCMLLDQNRKKTLGEQQKHNLERIIQKNTQLNCGYQKL